MKKIAYKNKLYKKRNPVNGKIPSSTNGEEGYSANFPNIGRGYSMPGEQAVPMSNSDEIIMLEEKKKKYPPADYNDMLDLFVQLGDQMDQDGEINFASFADFLITKIAEQKNNNYELLLKELIVNVSNSDLLNKNNLIVSLGRLYNQKYLELSEEFDDQTAHREAYQEAALLVEKNMAGRDG